MIQIKEKAQQFQNSVLALRDKTGQWIRNYGFFCIPGVTLIFMGLSLFLYPQILKYLFGIFLLSTGYIAFVGAIRFVQIRRKCIEVLKKFDGKIVVQGIPVKNPQEMLQILEIDDAKDPLIH